MSALGQKRTSANKLEAVLLVFRGRAASPRTCRRCQDHLHYRTTWQACLGNAGGRQSPLPQHQPWVGATDNPHDWEDAIAPPRQGRARAGVQGNLPWNAATTGHYLRPILSRSLGGSYMGTRSAQGTFVANRPL